MRSLLSILLIVAATLGPCLNAAEFKDRPPPPETALQMWKPPKIVEPRLIHFNFVPPGAYSTYNYDFTLESRGAYGEQIAVEVRKPFELMDAPVTNFQWAQISGEAFDGKLLNFPKSGISWTEAKAFITKLNELSQSGDPRLAPLIKGHQDGDTYRLPTEVEWALVAQLALAETENKGGNIDVKKIAWVFENSSLEQHEIMTRAPLYFYGQAFYDLYGNVEEWVEDAYCEDLLKPHLATGGMHATKGGSRHTAGPHSDLEFYRRGVRTTFENPERVGFERFTGVRLVREGKILREMPFIRR